MLNHYILWKEVIHIIDKIEAFLSGMSDKTLKAIVFVTQIFFGLLINVSLVSIFNNIHPTTLNTALCSINIAIIGIIYAPHLLNRTKTPRSVLTIFFLCYYSFFNLIELISDLCSSPYLVDFMIVKFFGIVFLVILMFIFKRRG